MREPGKPISPEDVGAAKADVFPPEVFDAFNEMIATRFVNDAARFEQDEVIDVIIGKLGISRQEVFSKHLLDVEDAYREMGWHVYYDKPAFNESYAATFKFTRPRR